jgi:hypothetical protein
MAERMGLFDRVELYTTVDDTPSQSESLFGLAG